MGAARPGWLAELFFRPPSRPSAWASACRSGSAPPYSDAWALARSPEVVAVQSLAAPTWRGERGRVSSRGRYCALALTAATLARFPPPGWAGSICSKHRIVLAYVPSRHDPLCSLGPHPAYYGWIQTTCSVLVTA